MKTKGNDTNVVMDERDRANSQCAATAMGGSATEASRRL